MGSRDGSILGRMGVSVSHRVSNRAKVVSPEMKDGQDPPITTEVTTGSASDEILHLARERKVDLIAIGTKGLTLLDEGVFGGTAKRVFSAAPSSVLAVRER